MAADGDGFLSRWSRRKNALLQGVRDDESQVPSEKESNNPKAVSAPLAALASNPLSLKVGNAQGQNIARNARSAVESPFLHTKAASTESATDGLEEGNFAVKAKLPSLSLEDTLSLTKDSDFTPFMSRDVSATVRNAAMKKLFADPHFNVMDGLDTYIDDYTKFVPLTEEVLRSMNGAKFLNLFGEDEKEDEADDRALLSGSDKQDIAGVPSPDLRVSEASSPHSAAPTESVSGASLNNLTGQTVAQSYSIPDIAVPVDVVPSTPSQPGLTNSPEASQPAHAHTDLRLQPNDAPPATDAGRGAQ